MDGEGSRLLWQPQSATISMSVATDIQGI